MSSGLELGSTCRQNDLCKNTHEIEQALVSVLPVQGELVIIVAKINPDGVFDRALIAAHSYYA